MHKHELVDRRELAIVNGIEYGLDKLLGSTTPNMPGSMSAVGRAASDFDDDEEILRQHDRTTLWQHKKAVFRKF